MASGQQPLLQHAAANIADRRAARAARWDSILRTPLTTNRTFPAASTELLSKLFQREPDAVQPHKVLACDLLGRGEVGLLLLLEPLMIKRRFAPCDHIVHAVRRFRYEQMPQHRHTALGACLTELCEMVGITLDQLFQFETLTRWAQQRKCCFDPLRHSVFRPNAQSVTAARTTITTSPELQQVRESPLLLLRMIESRLPAQPAA